MSLIIVKSNRVSHLLWLGIFSAVQAFYNFMALLVQTRLGRHRNAWCLLLLPIVQRILSRWISIYFIFGISHQLACLITIQALSILHLRLVLIVQTDVCIGFLMHVACNAGSLAKVSQRTIFFVDWGLVFAHWEAFSCGFCHRDWRDALESCAWQTFRVRLMLQSSCTQRNKYFFLCGTGCKTFFACVRAHFDFSTLTVVILRWLWSREVLPCWIFPLDFMSSGSLRLQFHRSLFGWFITLNHRSHLKLVHFEVVRKSILAFVVLNVAKVITADLSLN